MTTKIPVELSSTPSISDSGNATAITIDSSEQVGIGITSPQSQLHIGGSTPTITIGDGDGEDTKIIFDGNVQDYYVGLDDTYDIFVIGNGSTIGTNPFVTFNQGTSTATFGSVNADPMALSMAGFKVIIDTTATNASLQMNGNLGTRIDMGIAGARKSVIYSDANNFLEIARQTNHPMVLKTNSTERMRILNGGNIGIGTSSPSEKLEVNGTVKATAFEGDGSALTNVSGGGKLLQVVSTTKSDTWSSSLTGQYQDITGFNATITPSSTSSKILVNFHTNGGNNSLVKFRIVRGTTAIGIGANTNVGSRTRATTGGHTHALDANRAINASMTFLDTPSTTSATTYKIQAFIYAGVHYVNRTYNDTNANYTGRTISTITLMEIES